MTSLRNRTLFITGGSRGIGEAIALRAARDGANVVLAAKSEREHPKLPGTIYSVAKAIEAAGGKALPIRCDIRNDEDVVNAVAEAVKTFGGIDILINNASAISLTGPLETPMKRFDLMFGVDVRGTFLVSQTCLPHLKKSANPHILTLAPPLNMDPKWFAPHTAYTMAKYGMSMCTLGHAREFKRHGIGVNSLWPRTAINTAALQMIPGVDTNKCRTPQILSDAAWLILTSDPGAVSGNFFIDDELLAQNGVTDFDRYAVVPGTKDLLPDFFVD